MKKFQKFFEEQTDSVRRFFMPFAWTIFIFVLTTILIVSDGAHNIVETLAYVGIFGYFLAVLAKLKVEWMEAKQAKPLAQFLFLISLLAFVIYPFMRNHSDSFVQMGFVGLVLACIAAIMYFIANSSKSLTEFIKGAFFSGLIVGILCGGVALCIWAVHSLEVWEFSNVGKVYGVALSFIGIVGFFNLVLSSIPRQNEDAGAMNKIYKWILQVAFAIYLVLLAILVIYFGKLAVTMTAVDNRVALFGNIAVLFSVFFVFVLKQFQEENKLIRFFQKYIGYLLLLIIAMNFWGLYTRIGEYGLTAPRYICLWLNDLAVLFAILTLIKNGKWCSWIFPVAGLVAIMLTLTPMNVIKAPFENQKQQLISVLLANDMLDENWQPIAKADISSEDKNLINAKWRYISRSPMMAKTGWAHLRYEMPENIFGFAGGGYNHRPYVSYSSNFDIKFDISDFSTLEEFNNGEMREMNEWLYQLYLQHGNTYEMINNMYWDSPSGDRYYARNIGGYIDDVEKTAEVQWVSGYILRK